MARSQKQAKGAVAYGQEALSEWGNAIRYGGRAVATGLRGRAGSPERPPLRERLNPSRTEKGGRVGDAADAALARLGKPGKLASKVSLGSRIVDRIGIGGGAGNGQARGESSSDNGAPSEAAMPVPIQESIDVAVPLGGAFELGSQFLDFPEYLGRVEEVEEVDDSHFVFVAKARRRLHEMEVEIVDERPEERIEWECAGELGHAGVLTFHPLAPRLTRLELTIERRPEGVSERLSRQIHLPERAIQAELHRFKAHAELLDEDFEDYVWDEGAEPEEADDEEEEAEEQEAEEQVEEDELEPA
jgi:uncharacterized membrane protein